MKIDTPYYEDHERVSNSSIGWFLKGGPSYFYKMLKGEIIGDKTQSMDRGTMIHSYILTPEEFQKTYVVWDKSRPSSAQQEKFCQELSNTVEIEPDKAVLSAYKAAYSTAGKSDKTMLSEGLKIASTLKDYIDFLKLHDGRIMITPWDAKMLNEIKYNIACHKLARKIIWPKTDQQFHLDVEHEFHINWSYENKIQCKSLLDGLTLDFKNKKAIIYDLKTTQKLWHFEDSIDQYDYLRQLCYYKMAVLWYLEHECGQEKPELNGWTFEFYIIGIDTTGSNEIRVFRVEPYMVDSRDHVIEDALVEIAWHQSTGKWDHSREYYEGYGSETLNL